MAKTRRKKKKRRTASARPNPHKLSYDASATSTKRKSPNSRLKSADAMLPARSRQQLTANARDLDQNYAVAAWMIRRHLDYIASFNFRATTADPLTNQRIEALVAEHSRPGNCDIARRHGLARLLRLAEARRTIDGDCLLVKYSSGHMQAVESDRIRDPQNVDTLKAEYTQGVRHTAAGMATGYAVHNRTPSGQYEYQRTVQAQNTFFLAYYQRFDQIRGISPLAVAVNPLRDTYENFDYALARAKVSQLFGLVFYRDGGDSFDDIGDTESDGAGGYDVSFGDGPVKLDLDPGDRAEFLESKTPAREFVDFNQTMISLAMKALDLPYSFYSENFTNFFGSRAALLHYQKSAENKRADLIELLNQITAWWLTSDVAAGKIAPPPSGGEITWEWIPTGMPWWKPGEEIAAEVAAIQSGLRTRSEILKSRPIPIDFREHVDRLAEEETYLRKRNVSVDFGPGSRDTENTKAEPGNVEIDSVPGGDVAEVEEPITSEESIDISLNGAQVAAVIDVLEKAVAGIIAPAVAVEILVSVGVVREKAENMVEQQISGIDQRDIENE